MKSFTEFHHENWIKLRYMGVEETEKLDIDTPKMMISKNYLNLEQPGWKGRKLPENSLLYSSGRLGIQTWKG